MTVTEARGGPARLVALAAALFVVVLAAAAAWWPRPVRPGAGPVVVVLDPVGDERRLTAIWPALARVLAADGAGEPQVVVARTRDAFAALVTAGPGFVICPDGMALGLDASAWAPLAAGRRAAPRNLRPRSVLVSRRGSPGPAAPWLAVPSSVVFGDSLSLAGTGALRGTGAAGSFPAEVAWGPDPYDHAPALHALRLGAFAHAVVRQWDAERFRAQGLLPDAEWEIREVTPPVPDLVVLMDRRQPTALRLALGERLAGIGRELSDQTPAERDLAALLPGLGLAGFNLLIDPDFDLVRGNFVADWPRPQP